MSVLTPNHFRKNIIMDTSKTSQQRRIAILQSHLTSSTTSSTTPSSSSSTATPSSSSSEPIDTSKKDLKLRGWGYKDTHFFLNDDKVVELTGNKYPEAFGPNGRRLFPRLLEFMQDRLHMDEAETCFMTEKLPDLDPPILNASFTKAINTLIPNIEAYTNHECRFRHALGCTMEEVWAMRYADKIERAPDLVIYPKSHTEVEMIVKTAVETNCVIIPYGGGTSVSGALQCPTNETRLIISLDMSRMCRIKWVDRENMLACIEAGTIGTEIERKLGSLGLIMGHEPDSYEHSTMGGWIATVRFFFPRPSSKIKKKKKKEKRN